MAREKDNLVGVILGLAVLGAFIQTDEHGPPAPKICYVPQQDGTTIPVEIKELPCDQMVADALAKIERAKSLPKLLPPTVTIEETPTDGAPRPDSERKPEPAFTSTPDQLRELGQPLNQGSENETPSQRDDKSSQLKETTLELQK